MAHQQITWTLLPGGPAGSDRLRFALHVAPRLKTTGGADATLEQQFEDFVDWPKTLEGATIELTFPDLGSLTYPVDLTPAPGEEPSSQKWTALFPANTTVHDHAVPKVNGIKLASYPVANILDFLAEQWGKTGATSPEEYATFDELIGTFRDIGFLDLDEREGVSGWERLAELREELTERYTKHGGAIPYDPTDADTAKGRGLSFLQLLDFHHRNLKPNNNETPPIRVRQTLDFHKAVALTANHRKLQRVLGLVLECTTKPSRTIAGLLASPDQPAWCTVKLTVPGLNAAMTTPILPLVRCRIGAGRFEAEPRTDEQLDRGLLKVGDESRYGVFTVDPDGGALKAMQFAATMTRGHIFNGTSWRPRSLATSEEYALPALRTGGISVAKLGQAAVFLLNLKEKSDTNDAIFTLPPNSVLPELRLYAEDLVRGYRWDVRDEADTDWRTLMEREGSYTLSRLPAGQQAIPVREEAAVVSAVTTADTKSDDLYLQESVASWGGWSLGVQRVGSAVGLEGQVGVPEEEVDSAYEFDTSFAVPPGTLPRLRFGHSYRFRARAVDLGNGGLAPNGDDFAIGGPDTRTEVHPFLRFEPVEAPTIALRKDRQPGESPAHAVVRANHATSERHVVPPRTSQLMAEWHGVLDKLGEPGMPMDTATWDMLADRDSARLEDLLPSGEWDPHENPAHYDTDALPVPYLPDVLARNAMVRGLPPTPISSEVVPFANGDWPNAQSFRLVLGRAPVGQARWSRTGQVLNVWLEPGDIYRLRISSRFDQNDLELFGVWDWITTYVEKWNASHPPAEHLSLSSIRGLATRGLHWMLTPSRPTTLVHAVRTPLLPPTWKQLTIARTVNATSAQVVDRQFTISQKTTGTVDVVGDWTMHVDDGPGTPDPTLPQAFKATAFSTSIKHPIGLAPDELEMHLQGDHEFGDHKFRIVTYQAIATTPFVEYFREEAYAKIPDIGVPLGAEVAAETVKVRRRDGDKRSYEAAPRDQVDPATASGDYVVTPDTHTVIPTANGTLEAGTDVALSFARGPITRSGNRVARRVPSSARPAAPKVLYVVPTFKWSPALGGTTRLGGGLRIYLERPWYSSGDEERLGVVLPPTLPIADSLKPYVTDWAPDPVTVSKAIPLEVPGLSSFPLRDAESSEHGVSIAEVRDTLVQVAGHSVAFDHERDLWYCDLRVTLNDAAELPAYFPYVRLALARYQPNSLPDCELSKIVLADFIQLANARTVSIVDAVGGRKRVTVSGRGSVDNAAARRSQFRVIVERRTAVDDPTLGWAPVGDPVALAVGSLTDGNLFTWAGNVAVPSLPGTYRFVLEEYEQLRTGDYTGGIIRTEVMETRVVFTDIIPLP